ncbi:hypothetical protein [uncultured Fibrobacter sp.]|uniref:hypothetical protein n=1 Tax=uncultured Fibrobacter sp. TaxID=261512 RepID=UPI002629997B|nr:hypothetical protein [uncultured Fibrobacter sp.]
MNSQEVTALVTIAHEDTSYSGEARYAAIANLWPIYEARLMKHAFFMFEKIQPDFSMRELSTDGFRAELSCMVYEIFAAAVMKYDESKMASLETFVKNEICWRFLDEKRENSNRCAHEVVTDIFPCDIDDEDGLAGQPVADESDSMDGWKDLVSIAAKALGTDEQLLDFFKKHLDTLERCDRGEESETARVLGVSRMTVYNRLTKIRGVLKSKNLDREFKRLLAA